MKIRINVLIRFQIYYLLIVETLISIFNFPDYIRYILDANLIVMMAFYVVGYKKNNVTKQGKMVFRYIFFVILFFVITAIFRNIPVGQVLWAVRNNFFYIFYFIICINMLDKRDIEILMQNIVKFNILNVICGIYEFFVLHVTGDDFGGMFGCQKGCNGYLNVYLVVISSYVITRFILKKETILNMLLVVISSVILASVAELKIFYVELLVVVVSEVLLNKKSLKLFLALVGGVLALFVGLQVLSITHSDSRRTIDSIENMIEYGSREEFGDEIRIARLTAIQQIDKLFFKGNTKYRLIGYGFGSCEESETFSWANSKFAQKYGVIGYRNLSASMLYLETGAIGIILFLLIFVLIFVVAVNNKSHLKKYGYTYIAVFCQVMCLMCIGNIWYNSAIRREIAYLTFFVLSSVFIFIRTIAKEETGRLNK